MTTTSNIPDVASTSVASLVNDVSHGTKPDTPSLHGEKPKNWKWHIFKRPPHYRMVPVAVEHADPKAPTEELFDMYSLFGRKKLVNEKGYHIEPNHVVWKMEELHGFRRYLRIIPAVRHYDKKLHNTFLREDQIKPPTLYERVFGEKGRPPLPTVEEDTPRTTKARIAQLERRTQTKSRWKWYLGIGACIATTLITAIIVVAVKRKIDREHRNFVKKLERTKTIYNVDGSTIYVSRYYRFFPRFTKSNMITKGKMNHNTWDTLPEKGFQPLSNMRELDLSSNKIEIISTSAFVGLKSLSVLILRYNQINGLKSDMFLDLGNLRELDLSYNKIESLFDDTFLQTMNLQTLKINDNKIRTLTPHTFKDLYKISSIHLGNNKVSFLFPETFQSIFKGKENTFLNLSFNQITHVNKSMFFTKPVILDLRANPLSCKSINNIHTDLQNTLITVHPGQFCIPNKSGTNNYYKTTIAGIDTSAAETFEPEITTIQQPLTNTDATDDSKDRKQLRFFIISGMIIIIFSLLFYIRHQNNIKTTRRGKELAKNVR